MLDRAALDTALELLAPESFYVPAHASTFRAIRDLVVDQCPVDLVSVARRLRDTGDMGKVDVTYLGSVIDESPAVVNVAHHCRIVSDMARMREWQQCAHRRLAESYGPVESVQLFLDGCEQDVYGIARAARTRAGPEQLRKILADQFTEITSAAANGRPTTGIPTGYPDLDNKIIGLERGSLYIIAARPGMGKSAFAGEVAVNVCSRALHDDSGDAIHMDGGFIASLEMPRKQISARQLCSRARVDLQSFRSAQLTQSDWTRLTGASSELSRLPLWIDDEPGMNILQLRGKIRRAEAEMRRTFGEQIRVGIVVVDYLQLMRAVKQSGSRENDVREISVGLKELAKELDVPVVALSQLNRECESQKDKRPLLSHLRESGSLEQDADTIIFIYRDDYYNCDSSNDKGIAEIIVAKQRNGPTGTVRLRFIHESARFESLAPGDGDYYDTY